MLSTDPKCKKRKNRCSTLNFADNVDEDAQLSSDPISNIRRGRGSIFLLDVIKDRSSGVRKAVKYNKRGQAIGEHKRKILKLSWSLGSHNGPDRSYMEKGVR
ncbi:hypothetical protein RHMOL_Rhmol11G0018800 [Rhododendron molle]|uniref:Uncharacterized protein n=1 Tax=Rhododendron molle TaxID=49168 RepID=A0ACC0LN21_RHOML|nr:hypothetical protein RHMOL_Rhmol11G0018800 [Rhododendron molle]